MNFRPELAAAVMAGRKTVTRRLVSDNDRSPWWSEKCAYRVGQRVAICPGRGKHNIGHAVVTSVERMTLGYLSPRETRAEGFVDADGLFPDVAPFVEAWGSINGSYDPAALVWRIGLEAVRDA